MIRGIAILNLLIIFSACSKNKLEGPYEVLIGTYYWQYSIANDKNIFSNKDKQIDSTKTGYTIKVVLDNIGNISFYKNGNLLSKENYTIRDKETWDHGGKLDIKLKGKESNNWKTDNLVFNLTNDTDMSISYFPFHAIDDVINYYPGYGSGNNIFVKR